MTDFTGFDKYLETNLDISIAELSKLCAQPSVAAQNWGLEECAELVGELLAARGFDVQVLPTGGAPVVFAERKGKSAKTLLFYNHYDVQPPEPLDLWKSPPFEPDLRDGKLFARGVSDDKGHIISRLYAIDALLDEDGELPCNIKKKPAASTCTTLLRRTRSSWLLTPASGSLEGWTSVMSPCSTWVCAASAMWSSPLKQPRWTCIPVWEARSCPMPLGAWSGH